MVKIKIYGSIPLHLVKLHTILYFAPMHNHHMIILYMWWALTLIQREQRFIFRSQPHLINFNFSK